MTILILPSAGITITADGTGQYELEMWQPGPRPRENRFAQSEHLDGADLTGSRETLTQARISVRCEGYDLDDSWLLATALESALGNGGDTFELHESFGLTDVVFACLPATSIEIDRDPLLMEEGMLRVVATIPRQPLVTWTGP